ncbi:hypothetical protein V2J09_018197 [Rumex salicifolius]
MNGDTLRRGLLYPKYTTLHDYLHHNAPSCLSDLLRDYILGLYDIHDNGFHMEEITEQNLVVCEGKGKFLRLCALAIRENTTVEFKSLGTALPVSLVFQYGELNSWHVQSLLIIASKKHHTVDIVVAWYELHQWLKLSKDAGSIKWSSIANSTIEQHREGWKSLRKHPQTVESAIAALNCSGVVLGSLSISGKSRGFAFVTMSNVDDASAVNQNLDGSCHLLRSFDLVR